LSEKSAVSSPEKSAEQKIRIEITTRRMAKAAPVIIYGDTAVLAVCVSRRNACGRFA
jgi:hypothetical protein